jgi:diaminohydroxyphosphoribosylaminopyrimidine deaminase/5-amino-6-(5-phosphoribosylamino)uracil reductase
LSEAGVERVVYGVNDAYRRSAGRASCLLGAVGIPASVGVLGEECRRLLDYYLHAKGTASTFVHLKLALSLDAKMALGSGASQWLSGPQSLGYAHYLRQKYDAIMVGSGTVLTDNPRLTTRDEALASYWPRPAQCALRNPCRVVFDPRGELLDSDAALELTRLEGEFPAGLPPLVLVTASTRAPRGAGWGQAELLRVAADDEGRVNFGRLSPDYGDGIMRH